jgi:hypothetical protein
MSFFSVEMVDPDEAAPIVIHEADMRYKHMRILDHVGANLIIFDPFSECIGMEDDYILYIIGNTIYHIHWLVIDHYELMSKKEMSDDEYESVDEMKPSE